MAEKLFFPYRFLDHAIHVDVTAVYVDGHLTDRVVDTGARTVVLRGVQDWSEAVFRIRATLSPDRLARLFPEDEREAPPCRMMLVVHCDATRWRDGVTLYPTRNPGEWEGSIAVRRGGVRGAILAKAILVRAEDRKGVAPSFGVTANIRLADSAEWRFSFDRQATPPGGFMNTMWDNFSTSKSLKRRSHASLLYYLDLEEDESGPILYLNEGIEGLKEVLSNEATRGKAAAVRDIVFSAIAQSVWLAMTTESLLAVEQGADEPPKQWQRQVIATFKPLLGSIDAVQAIRNSEEVTGLIESLATAVQTHEPLRSSVVKLMAEIDANDSEGL